MLMMENLWKWIKASALLWPLLGMTLSIHLFQWEMRFSSLHSRAVFLDRPVFQWQCWWWRISALTSAAWADCYLNRRWDLSILALFFQPTLFPPPPSFCCTLGLFFGWLACLDRSISRARSNSTDWDVNFIIITFTFTKQSNTYLPYFHFLSSSTL